MISDDLFTLTLAQVGDEREGGSADTSGDTNAATTSQPAGDDTPPPKAKSPFGNMFWIVMIGMIVLWIFLLGGGSRKQKKRQAELLATMGKGSKVVTIGGIKGSVVEVRDDEVLVKVDESANTRLRFSKDAIRSVSDGAASGDSKS